jgi:hypothetical protein
MWAVREKEEGAGFFRMRLQHGAWNIANGTCVALDSRGVGLGNVGEGAFSMQWDGTHRAFFLSWCRFSSTLLASLAIFMDW